MILSILTFSGCGFGDLRVPIEYLNYFTELHRVLPTWLILDAGRVEYVICEMTRTELNR